MFLKPLLKKYYKVVAIGGGQGLGRVMSSLNFLQDRLAGIVATTDDGGSTGRLRAASGCIAWGDLRNCLNQLCSQKPNLARILFEYRFEDTGDLSGHNLGNLMLLALDKLCIRPLDAVQLIREMLQVKSFLIPMSEQPTKLAAQFNNEKIIVGESKIDNINTMPNKLMLDPIIKPTKEAVLAINETDVIILGPGSFMTSILPTLLITEIAEAIHKSSAIKIFIANVKSEFSIAGKKSISNKLQWMKNMTGIYPDILLWPQEETQPKKNPDCKIITAYLSDLEQPRLHDCQAMKNILTQIINTHLRK